MFDKVKHYFHLCDDIARLVNCYEDLKIPTPISCLYSKTNYNIAKYYYLDTANMTSEFIIGIFTGIAMASALYLAMAIILAKGDKFKWL